MTASEDTSPAANGAASREARVNKVLVRQTTHMGPLKSLVLYSSGVPRPLLRVVPIEMNEFLVQGTGVLLASALAFVAAFTATGLIVAPTPSVGVRVVISLVFAAAIFTVDRLLVRTPLRPYHFPRDVLMSLWEPNADARWYEILSNGLYRQGIFTTIRDFFSVVAKVSVRFALAALISFIVADVLVIYAFQPAVDRRATIMLQQQQRVAADKAKGDLEAVRTSVNTQREKNSRAFDGDPALAELNTRKNDAQKRVNSLRSDLEKLQLLANAEFNGTRGVRVTLSSGETWPANPAGTTGLRGCSIECQAANTKRDEVQNTTLPGAERDLTNVIRELDKKNAEIQPKIDDLNAPLMEQENTAVENYNKANDAAQSMETAPSDLLIRRAALHQLAQDPEPWNDQLSEPPPCTGSFAWLCGLQRAIFPTTPMGIYIGSFRAILFLIDTLPILTKIYYSMRKRRPFDVLVAALEETSVAESVNSLDRELNTLGAGMEERAVERRGSRHGQGARFVRQQRQASWRERRRMERMMRAEDRARMSSDRSAGAASGRRKWRDAKDRIDSWLSSKDLVVVIDRDKSPWREPRTLRDDEV
ncbi:DUF4407 domain-containing protein [Mycolicibacterium neoaurum]|uniref:DUF4407 domain-containing protein n=1 Tax=Mycolicibacterium neoaurum TaxID=1795 RepID=UPI00248CA0F1|nr:DUF4407 domain-containing protein [Mycolicibacterium neoaurum]WBP93213.1 DUF4407 domain-containing protein [Mycolicibacterium neoaurum]WBS06820.1 DUF4407 domain-containing protein [Mycolicibacterium neoaurum]